MKNKIILFSKKNSETFGSELISNGTFDSNILGWSDPSGSWVWDATNQDAKFTFNGVNNRNFSYAISGLTIGATYQISFEFKNTNGGTCQYSDQYTTVFNGGDTTYHATNGVHTFNVTCDAESGNLTFRSSGGVGGDTIELDNVSVKELL